MPVLVPGRTTCRLCGRVIEAEAVARGFAPFVANEADPLRTFHDAVFHDQCVIAHPLGEEAMRWNVLVSAERPCDACEQPIDPEEALPFGLLTSDSASPLYRFNAVRLHRACVERWHSRTAFCVALSTAIRTKAAKGKGIDWLAAQVCNMSI
jgi:hypothetical protein